MHVGDWTMRYDGYRSKVTVEATAQEFLFLYPGPGTEGLDVLGNAECLVELGRLCAEAVHTLLYDCKWEFLRQSVIYPVVMTMPGLFPLELPRYLSSVAGAMIFAANNMLSAEGQDQPAIHALIEQYGVNTKTTIHCEIGHALTYTFATPQHIFLVRPVGARAMPLEVRMDFLV